MNGPSLSRMAKEPLLHFLLIGGGLFLAFGWRESSSPAPGAPAGMGTTKVVVTQDDLSRLIDLYSKTWQRLPTDTELSVVVEDFVRNEVFYREALAIGLERDDEVIKRRLRQKMEFIFDNIAALGEPTDEELKAFMGLHRAKYLADPKVGFRQVFISTSKRGARADQDARELLAQLAAGADPDQAGDPTLLEPVVKPSPLWDIRKQFGDDFAKVLLTLKPGAWAGPVRSTYGLHLVLLQDLASQRLPELRDIREIVRQDWIIERQRVLRDEAYAKIRARYEVVVEPPRKAAQAKAEGSTP